MKHDEITNEIAERIALRTLERGESEEADAWESHLAACDLCRAEHLAAAEALSAFPLSLDEADPSPELKARLMERVGRPEATAAPADAMRLMDFEAMAWEPSETEGVSFHWLRRGHSDGTVVALARLRQGCSFPRHSHPGGEDCFVLQGGFREDGRDYRAGQFVYYQPGTQHGDFRVLPGADCIVLVVSHGGIGPAEGSESRLG